MAKEKVIEEFEAEEPVISDTEDIIQPEVQQEVTLDDLDKTPDVEKFRKIRSDEKIEAKTLTIGNIKLGKPLTKDASGVFIEPEQNSNGSKYYKAKMIVEFVEEVNGDKIREFLPSIFYSVNESGQINKIPTIPKACPDEKLEDNFTSELAKLKNKFCKHMGKGVKEMSSAEFVKGLIGKEVKIKIKTGEFKGRKWQKIQIVGFV